MRCVIAEISEGYFWNCSMLACRLPATSLRLLGGNLIVCGDAMDSQIHLVQLDSGALRLQGIRTTLNSSGVTQVVSSTGRARTNVPERFIDDIWLDVGTRF
jgi:hypothetical protein